MTSAPLSFRVLQCPVLLSDSRLHLFLQTQLSLEEIEACASGQTKYSVSEAIHKFATSKRRFPAEEEEQTSCHLLPESSSSTLEAKHFLNGCKPAEEHKDMWKTVLAPSPPE
ncbi:hypothetical protein GDO78_003020 [Eleutherodactylus coqui]|uniref:Uncharacterized protein n=1 Tax=Eleutherodactylus coqui TaxID=57060 RepID=A0A8J6EWG3_ELECQ|nr:hypothetical protein GDO78_003020 [Eleutherodactylus coqui]